MVDCRFSGGSDRLSRNRLYTFSTSTMASSTSDPMAIAMPPRLMVLMVYPIRLRTSTDIITDKGRGNQEISVVRIFIRKKNSTTITNSAPSSSDSCRLEMELSMKELWRNMSVEIFTSEGRVDFSSSSDLSIFSVRGYCAGCRLFCYGEYYGRVCLYGSCAYARKLVSQAYICDV